MIDLTSQWSRPEDGDLHHPDINHLPAESIRILPDGGVVLPLAQWHGLCELLWNLARNCQSVSPFLDKIQVMRVQANYLSACCKPKERFLQESEDALAGILCQSEDSAASTSDAATRDRLREQLLIDRDDLRQQQGERLKVEAEIGQLEYQMRNIEDALNTAARSVLDLFYRWHLPGMDQLQPAGLLPQPSIPASPDLPPSESDVLWREFQDARKQVSNERKKFIRLETKYRDALVNRGLREDQGNPPSTPDETFEADWAERFRPVVHEFETARERAEIAKAACLQKGVEVPPEPSVVMELFSEWSSDEEPCVPERAPEPWGFEPATVDEDADMIMPPNEAMLCRKVERWRQHTESQREATFEAIAGMPESPMLSVATLKRRKSM